MPEELKKKPINKVAKGYRKEKLCFDSLAEYPNRWKTIRHQFCNIDLFKMFDVVVANKEHMRFIQVKSGYCPNEVRDKIRAIELPPCCIKEIWCYMDGGEVRKEVISQEISTIEEKIPKIPPVESS